MRRATGKRHLLGLVGLELAVLALLGAGRLNAQEWADKMFASREHDFGAVPRAAKMEYAFALTNLYKEDVHIASVRSSCGCTLPRIEKDTLKTYEKGAIVAEFNTRAFLGQHGAHLTVTIDKPYWAEVHLDVRGYIRTDVVVDPSQVTFGTVPQGSAADRKITIEYAGSQDWKVLEVKPGSPYLTAAVKETGRTPGRASYELDVKLADNAPVGYLRDVVTLTTNDGRAKELPIIVEGRVAAELTVSPSPLTLGALHPGQTVTKQLIVRAKRPFQVTNVKSDAGAVTFQPSTADPQPMHVVPITFTAGAQPGKIVGHITIETDLATGGTADVQVIGEVASPLAGN